MRKSWWAALGACGAVSCATPAAATYTFHITGTITEQIAPGTDPNIAVGDTIHVDGSVADDHVETWGSLGYKIAFFNRDSPFAITLNGLAWKAADEEMDRDTLFTRLRGGGADPLIDQNYSAPAVVFNDSGVLGLIGFMIPVQSSTVPILQLGSHLVGGSIDQYRYRGDTLVDTQTFIPVNLSLDFTIRSGNNLYFDTAVTPGFNGVWNASVDSSASIPEPTVWMFLISGLAATGIALRRHRRTYA